MGSPSAFRAVASEITSASHVELAVEPWRFERQAKRQQRLPSSLRSSSHRPDVVLVLSRSLAQRSSLEIFRGKLTHKLKIGSMLNILHETTQRPVMRQVPGRHLAG
jgi:hypothetical protein